MNRLPFGVKRLDSLLGGGAPEGSAILLAGEPGAGAREFLATCVLMNGLALEDLDEFSLAYGDFAGKTSLPEEVHYVSLTDDVAGIKREFTTAFDVEFTERASSPITFADLSSSYFRFSPVPRDWYTEPTTDIESLGNRSNRETVFEALATYLSEHATESLVCLDSVTDLLSADAERSLDDVATVLNGVRRAASDWEGLRFDGSAAVATSHERWNSRSSAGASNARSRGPRYLRNGVSRHRLRRQRHPKDTVEMLIFSEKN